MITVFRENVMAVNQTDPFITEIESICAILKVAHGLCEQQKEKLAKICADSRQILKPWPRKTKPRANQPEGQTQGQTQGPAKTVENTTTVHGESDVLPEERAGLTLVEKALAKAEKTRSRYHRKFEEVNKSTSASDSGVASQEASSLLSAPGSEPRSDNVSEVTRSHSGKVKVNRDDKGANLPHKNGLNASGKLGSAGSKPGSSHRGQKVTSQGKPVVISQNKLNKLLEKPKLAGKVTSRYAPVHTKAPFKTETAGSRPVGRGSLNRVRSADQRPSAPKSGSARRRVSDQVNVKQQVKTQQLTNSTRTNPGSKPLSGRDVLHETNPHTNSGNHNNRSTENLEGNERVSVETDRLIESNSNLTVSTSSAVNHLLPQLEDLRINQDNTRHRSTGLSDPTPTPQADQTHTEEKFCLEENGRQLTLPVKFSKLMAQNRRLREKVKVKTSTSGVDDITEAAADFLGLLQQHLDEDEEGLLCVKKMLSLCSLYDDLKMLLSEVPNTQLTETCDWQEALRYKQKLGFVLKAFSAVTDSHKMILRELGPDITRQSSSPVSNKPSSPASADPCWLPREVVGEVPCVPGVTPLSGLCYMTKTQLIRYTAVVHQVQLLQWTLYMLDLVAGTVRILGTYDINTSELYSVYRGVYSLTCNLGRVFPTLVQDNIEDTEEDPNQCDTDF